MTKTYEGISYRQCDFWLTRIEPQYQPINYLEVGVFFGANLLSVADTYAHHPESQMYCIDPWENYKEYNEYEEVDMNKVFEAFKRNIELIEDKVHIRRGYSCDELPKLPDNYFDIIYLDGNHDYQYVLQDAIISFEKLKVGGYMIFDDYDMTWMGVIEAVTRFTKLYKSRVKSLGVSNCQVFLRKLT